MPFSKRPNFNKNGGISKKQFLWYDKWNFKPQISSISNFEYVNEVWMSGVLCVKRTGSLNYFEVFAPPWSFFFHVLNEIFAPPCSLITSCMLNRYYRVTNKQLSYWFLIFCPLCSIWFLILHVIKKNSPSARTFSCTY